MGYFANLFVVWIVSALVIAGTAYILPGVSIKNFGTALLVAIVLGLVNVFIRPLLLFFTLPINLLTLGLFTFIINALMIMLTAAVVKNFKVNTFWDALLFSIIISIVRIILLSRFNE